MNPAVRYHPLVAHSISGTPARLAVLEVLDDADCRAVSASPDRPARALREPTPPDLLVYDLAPFDGVAYRYVRDVRTLLTTLPVLLYPPPRPRVGELLQRCTRLPFVNVEIQDPSAPLAPAFRSAFEKTLAVTPVAQVLELMRKLLPRRPPVVTEYLRAVLFGLQTGIFGGPPRLHLVARKLGTTRRTIERQWKWNALPSPKELADWATILLVTRAAADLGARTITAAHAARLNSQHLYRIRRRLRLLGQPAETADMEFSSAVIAFAERCRERRFPPSRWYEGMVAM